MNSPHEPNATIVDREDVHDGLMLLRVAPDGGEFPPFRPGQFVSLGYRGDSGRLVKRSYSIGSSAHQRRQVELFIVRVDDGAFTAWLFDRRAGDRVWLSPRASGGFTLDAFPRGADFVFVSTGTAIAPGVSMLRTYGDDAPWRRAVVINGVRYVADFGYRAEIEARAARDPRVVYLPTVTREPADSGWGGLRGRVSELLAPARYRALAGAPLDPATCHVYLCGNPMMIEELEATLGARGFQRHTRRQIGNLHMEKYWTD
jgi:ferredoxin--NADP+ reductase